MRLPKINKIIAPDIKTAIDVAFDNYDKFAFFHNIELKDVKKRFRIFNYKGKVYVVKQANKAKARKEISNGRCIAKKINGLVVSDIMLHVIESELIETKNGCFLISEYKGNTLHEYIYNSKKIPLSKENFIKIFEQILRKGIILPGFLPRNLILNTDGLFLLDLENVFYTKTVKNLSKYISFAEFINNWSCLYAKEDLLNFISKYQSNIKKNNQIGSFEKEYALLTGCNENKSGLKNEIEDIIMVAEYGNRISTNEHMIASDLGHLVSDTFPRCIDVIHDLLLYKLQKEKNELHKYLILMTTYYKFYISSLGKGFSPQKGYLLLPMFLVIDKKMDVINEKEIKTVKNALELTMKIVKRLPKTSLSYSYLFNNKSLREQFSDAIHKNIIKLLPISRARKNQANLTQVVECVQEIAEKLTFFD